MHSIAVTAIILQASSVHNESSGEGERQEDKQPETEREQQRNASERIALHAMMTGSTDVGHTLTMLCCNMHSERTVDMQRSFNKLLLTKGYRGNSIPMPSKALLVCTSEYLLLAPWASYSNDTICLPFLLLGCYSLLLAMLLWEFAKRQKWQGMIAAANSSGKLLMINTISNVRGLTQSRAIRWAKGLCQLLPLCQKHWCCTLHVSSSPFIKTSHMRYGGATSERAAEV